MGQKVNPSGLRLGINRTWDSKWYSESKYGTFLENDLKIRKHIDDNFAPDSILHSMFPETKRVLWVK